MSRSVSAYLPAENKAKAFFKLSETRVNIVEDGNVATDFVTDRRETKLKDQVLKSKLQMNSYSSATSRVDEPLEIRLRLTQGAESNPLVRAAIERAVARWQTGINRAFESPFEKFNITIDIDYATTAFGSPFQSSITTARTRLTQVLGIATQAFPFSVFWEDRYYSYEHQRRVQQEFTETTIGTDLGNTPAFNLTSSVRQALGYGPLTEYRHVIAFNSAINYDFDSSDGIDPDKLDFEALALRELGRLLGFISYVGVRETVIESDYGLDGPTPTAPTMWDWFRFRPGVTMEDFSSARRVQRAGGEQVFFTGDIEAPLASGAADANDWAGLDRSWLRYGRAAGHWKDDALTGQYIGIMDESYLPGERGGITATDLTTLSYFGYRITPDVKVMEVLSVDDGSREQALSPGNFLLVNRLTPARAPFNVESVRVQLPPLTDGSSPVGKRLRVVVFADASRSGQPPANPQYLVDRTIAISALPENRMLEAMLPQPVAVNGGDLYVGVQSVDGDLGFAADTDGEANNRSFISTGNGAGFQPLNGNAILRAAVNARFNALSNLLPEVKEISPTAAPAGTGFKLTVFGRNFFPDSADAAGVRYKSVIRVNGQDKATEFLSLKQLRTELSAADLAGSSKLQVTVATTTPNGVVESAPMELAITPEAPAPSLTRLDPQVVAAGGSETKVIISGRNFTVNSMARINGGERPTRFINSTKLEATIPASDLAAAKNIDVVVQTPSPGGGASNALPLVVAGCSYKLSQNSFLNLGAARRFTEDGELNLRGVILETEDHCAWTAVSNNGWIQVADKQSKGRAPVGFNILNNVGPAERTGTITIAGQTLTINQVGFPATVSSASYGAGSSPAGIATIFGLKLAKTTQVATTQPLPTNLAGTKVKIKRLFGLDQPEFSAQLLFVSPTQINLVMPEANNFPPLDPRGISFSVTVYVDGRLVADAYTTLSPVYPGLFSADASGRGVAAAVVLRVKADGSQSYEPAMMFDQAQNKFVARAIDLGPEGERVFLILFGTGIRGRTQLSAVNVRVGGSSLPALYAGAQGDFAGLDQVNVELPRSLAGRGEIDVTCTANNNGSNPVRIRIQ